MFLFYFTGLLLALALFTNTCLLRNASQEHEREPIETTNTPNLSSWKPATFKGLTIGVNTRQELQKLLGAPLSTYDPIDLPKQSLVTDINEEFYYSGEIRGKLVASSSKKSGVLSGISIYPEDLSLEQLIRLYGKDYVVTRYNFVECPNDQGSSLIKEDPKGGVEYIEYRSKGLVIDVDYTGKKVNSLEFVSGAIGVTNYRCQ